jgi:site-specific DNA-methyltransferase (adenine-specific)
VVTSPPYWNKADYGDYEGNIGSIKFYDDFLNYMETVISNCYRVLMPGRKLCIVTANVNQNTKEYGLVTIPIASDLTKIAQQKGFSLVNQIIWNKNGTGGKWGSANSQRPIFGSYPYPPNFLFKNVNEYIIIVQKPDPKKKNSKAPSYFDLFRNEPR